MCGRWTSFSWGEWCANDAHARTNATYAVNVPLNSTVKEANWFVEPAWATENVVLYVNGMQIFKGSIQGFRNFNITQYIHPGSNVVKINGETGADDGASNIRVSYATSDIQTFVHQSIFPFQIVSGESVLRHEKSLFIPDTINSIEVVINTSSKTRLSFRKNAQNITIGTKDPQNNKVFFSNSEIKAALDKKLGKPHPEFDSGIVENAEAKCLR